MDEFNSKIIDCYNITDEVISKYRILYSVMVNYAFEDSSLYECYVNDVLSVVLKECNIYRKLTLDDIDVCLKFFDSIDCDNSKINSRFRRKLEVLKDIYCGNKISSLQLGLDFISYEMDFSLFDSVIALVDIEMMIRVREKLDNLNVDNTNDLMFVKLIYQRFNATLFAQVVDNNLTEMIVLFNNMEMNKIHKFNMINLIDIISDKYKIKNETLFEPLELVFLYLSKITVDRLSLCEFENKPEIVFDNLAFITRLEVLITYMSKDSLNKLLEYCELYRDRNMVSFNNVIKLVKDKLK